MKIETSKQTEIKRKILIQIKFYILSFIGTSFDRKIENSVLAKLFFFVWIYMEWTTYCRYIDRLLLKNPLLEMLKFFKYALWKMSLFFLAFKVLTLKAIGMQRFFSPAFIFIFGNWKNDLNMIN